MSNQNTSSASSSPDIRWAERFPTLYAGEYVSYSNSDTTYTTSPPPDDLISRLHLIAVTEDGLVVVCRSDRGWRFLPGGTREPGESVSALARRELMEEAGAVLLSEPRYVSAHVSHSRNEAPYRAHQPHPVAYWAYAVALVEVTCAPTMPDEGAEQIVEVLALSPVEAANYIEAHDPTQAEVLRHAIAMGVLAV
jgi:8-oxo-dGTP diphosphatase